MGNAGQPQVVVVGGGIGGLATALALQRQGCRARVLERSGLLGAHGAGLVLSPSAQRCLVELGIAQQVRARATVLARSVVRRPSGRELARVDLGGRGSLLGILRADLVEVLASSLEPGVLELGHGVGDVADLDADVVVGADGLRSTVRAAMGRDTRPQHRGYTVWRALVPPGSGVDLAADGVPTLSETWGRGLRFGSVPVARGWTYVYACVSDGRAVDDLGDLRRLFAGWHGPVPELLAAMEPGTVLRHEILDLRPGATPLHHGRLVLVGDAAHAMEPNLGQGAGLALEDAVVLARYLAHASASASTVEAALSRYARARGPRVASLGRQSRRIGRVAQHAHPAVVGVRDLSMLAVPSGLARRAAARTSTWRPPVAPVPTPLNEEIR